MAFLIIGVVCALISRVLLFTAALNVSGAWAVGVLLPFGPILFRLNYPEDAYRSRMFRIATLPCFFLYIILGPGPSFRQHLLKTTQISVQPVSYGMEKPKASPKRAAAPGPSVELTPSTEERRISNTREFERLRPWGEALRLKKRDLLHSDTAGNATYAAEFAQYTLALETAKAERSVLWPPAK